MKLLSSPLSIMCLIHYHLCDEFSSRITDTLWRHKGCDNFKFMTNGCHHEIYNAKVGLYTNYQSFLFYLFVITRIWLFGPNLGPGHFYDVIKGVITSNLWKMDLTMRFSVQKLGNPPILVFLAQFLGILLGVSIYLIYI